MIELVVLQFLWYLYIRFLIYLKLEARILTLVELHVSGVTRYLPYLLMTNVQYYDQMYNPMLRNFDGSSRAA